MPIHWTDKLTFAADQQSQISTSSVHQSTMRGASLPLVLLQLVLLVVSTYANLFEDNNDEAATSSRRDFFTKSTTTTTTAAIATLLSTTSKPAIAEEVPTVVVAGATGQTG